MSGIGQALLLLCSASCSAGAGTTAAAPVGKLEVVRSLPHDTAAFTQGLFIHDGRLYESTGGYGTSWLREVEPATGAVLREASLAQQHFGEGSVAVGDRVYQLTWRSRVCFVYDLATFERVGELAYEGEGWGLTTDGTSLIVSDGTPRLRFYDPATMRLTREVPLRDEHGAPLADLNELEWVSGEVWGNIWRTQRIARIDPHSGRVIGWVELTGVLPAGTRLPSAEAVANGIAYDQEGGRLFVTGKLWPLLLEVRLR